MMRGLCIRLLKWGEQMMEKVTFTLTIEAEKLQALEVFLKKEDTNVKKRLDEALQQLYDTTVPETVREYVGYKIGVAARDRSRHRAPKPTPGKDVPAAAQEDTER